MNARVLRKWSPNTKLMLLMRQWWSWWWLLMVTMLLLTVCAPLATAFQQQQQQQENLTKMNQTILRRSLLYNNNNKSSPKNWHFNSWQLQQQLKTTAIIDHDAVGVVEDSYYIPVASPADSSNTQHQQQSTNRLISSSSNSNSSRNSSSNSSRDENISFKRTSYISSRNSSSLSKSQQNINRQNSSSLNNSKLSSSKNLSDKISIKDNSENWSWPSYLMNLNKAVIGSRNSNKLNLTNDQQLANFHIDVMHDNNKDVEPDEQDYQHVEDIDDNDDENNHFDDDDDDDNDNFFNISDNEHDTMLKTSQKSTLPSQQQQQQQQQLKQQQQLMHTSQSDIINMRSLKSRKHIVVTSTLAPLRYLIESYEIPASLPYAGEEKQQQEFESENYEQQAARSRRDSRAFVGSVGGMSGIGLPASGFTNFYNRPPSLPPNQQQQPQLPISDFNNNYNYFHKQFSQHPQQSQQPTPTQVQHRFTNFQHIQHQQHQPYYHQHQRFFPTQQQQQPPPPPPPPQQQSTYGPKIVKQPTSLTPALPKPILPILPQPILPPATAHFPTMSSPPIPTTPPQQQAVENIDTNMNAHQHQHQHHHHHHHHHKHPQHNAEKEQQEIEYTTQKHVAVEEEVPQTSFPVHRSPTLFPPILLPTHHRPRQQNQQQQQQHRKHHHPRRYCSARDPAQLAYEAPTVFEGRIVSMTPDRRANFSATVEVKEVYKQQIGSYRLQKYLRLQFTYRNTTSECDIYREQLRQRGLVRGDELEQGRIYLMFVEQVDLGNFTILGQPMKKTRRVVEAVKEAVSENYAPFTFS